ELGDKVSDADKAPVNEALETLKTAISGGDIEDIKAKTEALEKAFYALSEKLYAATGANAGAQADPNADASNGGDGTYYNADYEDKTNQ
ncbi:MAG: molecular chaperone DnaK, partial [Clostridia bacterium]|nr:molecular chaperone DnaK [Clostridia bacterium]